MIDHACEQLVNRIEASPPAQVFISGGPLNKIEQEFLTQIYGALATIRHSTKVCTMDRLFFLPAFALLLALPLSACSTAFEDGLIDDGPEYSQFASQQATLRSRAKAAFRQSDFAGAERTFRAALAKDPLDPEAWLGFAAASDRLGRFEVADKAYAQVIAIAGRRGEVVNNMGWSQWHRGNHAAAKLLFAEALTLAPGNPVIVANASAKSSES